MLSERRAAIAEALRGGPDVSVITPEEVLELLDRIDALESRCADKDASIADLIEQLGKAEARLASVGRS